MRLVVDSNIFIAALLRDSSVRNIFVWGGFELLFPEAILDEIEEHKEELLEKLGFSEEEFKTLISKLLGYVTVVSTGDIIRFKQEANEIIARIDKDDMLFIATSLAFDFCPIWSDDKNLKKQNKIKIYSTSELINHLHSL